MTREPEDEPIWGCLALMASFSLLVLSVGLGLGRGGKLWGSSAGGDAGYAVMGEATMLVLYCSSGVVLAWLLAGAAALKKSRFGLFLLALETPFLLYALYSVVILSGGG